MIHTKIENIWCSEVHPWPTWASVTISHPAACEGTSARAAAAQLGSVMWGHRARGAWRSGQGARSFQLAPGASHAHAGDTASPGVLTCLPSAAEGPWTRPEQGAGAAWGFRGLGCWGMTQKGPKDGYLAPRCLCGLSAAWSAGARRSRDWSHGRAQAPGAAPRADPSPRPRPPVRWGRAVRMRLEGGSFVGSGEGPLQGLGSQTSGPWSGNPESPLPTLPR